MTIADLPQNAMIGPYAQTGQKYVQNYKINLVLVYMMYVKNVKTPVPS
jgi:hypothetical protein